MCCLLKSKKVNPKGQSQKKSLHKISENLPRSDFLEFVLFVVRLFLVTFYVIVLTFLTVFFVFFVFFFFFRVVDFF